MSKKDLENLAELFDVSVEELLSKSGDHWWEKMSKMPPATTLPTSMAVKKSPNHTLGDSP